MMNLPTPTAAFRGACALAIGTLLGIPVLAYAQQETDAEAQPPQQEAQPRQPDTDPERAAEPAEPAERPEPAERAEPDDQVFGTDREQWEAEREMIDPREWRRQHEARVQQRREPHERTPYAREAEPREMDPEQVFGIEREEWEAEREMVDPREWRRQHEARVQQRREPHERAPYAIERKPRERAEVFGIEREEWEAEREMVDPREFRRQHEARVQQRRLRPDEDPEAVDERRRMYYTEPGIQREMQPEDEPDQQQQQQQQRQEQREGDANADHYPIYPMDGDDPRLRDRRFPEDRSPHIGIYTPGERRGVPHGADPADPWGDRERRQLIDPLGAGLDWHEPYFLRPPRDRYYIPEVDDPYLERADYRWPDPLAREFRPDDAVVYARPRPEERIEREPRRTVPRTPTFGGYYHVPGDH